MRKSGIEPKEELCVCNVAATVLRYESPAFSITACYLEQEESITFGFSLMGRAFMVLYPWRKYLSVSEVRTGSLAP